MKKIILLILLMFIVIGCIEEPPEDDTNTSLTPLTDALTLDVELDNQSFIEDGFGEVTLSRCVDGDTARFLEAGVTEDFSVRFTGIDTPETFGNEEPWGRAASAHTCSVLQNAEQIILQHDPATARRETYGRFLAFVWVDGRLLNLELVELSLADQVGAGSTQYGDLFLTAWFDAINREEKIHGEEDPLYNYE